MMTNILLSYLAHFFLECEMFQTYIVEKIKTQILCAVTPPRKSRFLCDVKKYSRVG
jgi:hypothetical protein